MCTFVDLCASCVCALSDYQYVSAPFSDHVVGKQSLCTPLISHAVRVRLVTGRDRSLEAVPPPEILVHTRPIGRNLIVRWWNLAVISDRIDEQLQCARLSGGKLGPLLALGGVAIRAHDHA